MNEQRTNTDDVTFSEFLKFLKGFFLFCLKAVGFVKTLLRKYILYFIFSILAGAVLGYMIYSKSKVYYEGGITLGYTELHKRIYGEMIVTLNKYVNAKSIPLIAKSLNVDTNVAASLVSIEAKNLANSPLQDDITMEKLPFYVRYRITDFQNASLINEGLLYYMKNNHYNKVRRDLKVASAKEKITFIDQQMKILDSLKIATNRYLLSGASTSNSAKVDMAELFKQSEIFFNSRQDAEWVLSSDNSVELIDQYYPVPVRPGLAAVKSIVKFAIAAFVLCFIIVFCHFLYWNIQSDKQ